MTVTTCDCSVTDFDGTRCSRSVIRRARKKHECIECLEPIWPGQQYEDATGIDADGYAYQFRTCLPCKRIREHYCPRGWIWGELAELVKECIGWDYRKVPEGDDERFDGDVPVATMRQLAARHG